MTYSIIDTEFDAVVSTYNSAQDAEEALHEMCHIREYIDGKVIVLRTTAALHHRIRNDATSQWIEHEQA